MVESIEPGEMSLMVRDDDELGEESVRSSGYGLDQ